MQANNVKRADIAFNKYNGAKVNQIFIEETTRRVKLKLPV